MSFAESPSMAAMEARALGPAELAGLAEVTEAEIGRLVGLGHLREPGQLGRAERPRLHGRHARRLCETHRRW